MTMVQNGLDLNIIEQSELLEILSLRFVQIHPDFSNSYAGHRAILHW